MTERLLVVEGPADKHVFWAILKHHQFTPHFEVRDEGGFENLLRRLSVYLKPGSDLERLGIVVDADSQIRSRWESLTSVFERSGYTDVPDVPAPDGTVLAHDDLPRLGLWIMPDNTLPGMLEDYLCFLVPANDSLFARAKQCVGDIPTAERLFAEVHLTKAIVHTWLAWQDDPGTPLGQAITKRYFDPEGPAVRSLLAWLARLFA
jgi:Protein of unknown function (DUF3226)